MVDKIRNLKFLKQQIVYKVCDRMTAHNLWIFVLFPDSTECSTLCNDSMRNVYTLFYQKIKQISWHWQQSFGHRISVQLINFWTVVFFVLSDNLIVSDNLWTFENFRDWLGRLKLFQFKTPDAQPWYTKHDDR